MKIWVSSARGGTDWGRERQVGVKRGALFAKQSVDWGPQDLSVVCQARRVFIKEVQTGEIVGR